LGYTLSPSLTEPPFDIKEGLSAKKNLKTGFPLGGKKIPLGVNLQKEKEREISLEETRNPHFCGGGVIIPSKGGGTLRPTRS